MKLADVDITYMTNSENAAVHAIELNSFADPWSVEQIREYRAHRKASSVVALNGDSHVVGYCLYMLDRARIQIDRLAVRPEDRRTGIGAALIERLVCKMPVQRRKAIDIAVNVSRPDSLEFLRRNGFIAIGLRGDLVLMRYAIDPDLTVWSGKSEPARV